MTALGDYFNSDGFTFWLAVSFLMGFYSVLVSRLAVLEEVVRTSLARTLLNVQQILLELQGYLKPLIPKTPKVKSAREWEDCADHLRVVG